MVLDETVPAPSPFCQRVHRCLHDPGDGQVVRVRRLPALEENVRVLGRAPHVGGVRAHAPAAELDNGICVDQSGHVLGRKGDYFRQLMRSPEPVEEMEERYSCPEGGSMGDQGEVVRLLHRAGRQHGPARGPGVHHVGVVAEDRQGVGGDGTGGHMDHRRGQLPGDLEHVGHHQQQALRRRKCGGQGAFLQGAVEGTCRARL